MSEPTTYCIDEHDTIVSIDDAWVQFGQENDLLLRPDEVVGKPLWRFLADPQTQELYFYALKRVREEQVVLQLPFRCDGPSRRRYMELQIRPLPQDHIQFTGSTVGVQDRPPLDLFDANTPRTSAYLNVCSWCKKLELSGANWMDVEDAIVALHLFEALELPELRHRNCPACVERIRAELHPCG